MVGLFPFERSRDTNPRQSPSVPSLSGIQFSGGGGGQKAPAETSLADLESQKKKSFFSRPWTRRDIAILGSLGFLGLVLIALIIALPIFLIRSEKSEEGGDWQPYRPKHNDPSYRIAENKPIWALWDFPDPGLLKHNGTWYAFGTNPRKNDPDTIHVPVATSTDFVSWTLHEGYDAMPTIGGWERKINHWAPDVIQRDDGKFVLYYAGETKDFGRHHCVGAAVSERDDPLGPYVPLKEVLACPHQYGGGIDPSPFRDVDGTMYVVYKGDGNSVGHGGHCNNSKKPLVPVPLLLHELKSDGITPIGEPTIILHNIKSDGPLVEAPDIIRTNEGTYYLFFSSHCFTSLGYNVKYAHAKSIKGPYTRIDRPLLQTGDFGLQAPGGATVSLDGTKMVFHANCDGWRCMYVGAIDIRSNSNTIVMSSLELQISANSTTNSTTSS